MRTVNIHEAKTHLSRLVDEAAKGEPFMIAQAGKPRMKVVRIDPPAAGEAKRLGFMAGEIESPDDFDTMGSKEIERLFKGGSQSCFWTLACFAGLPACPPGCRPRCAS
jgi:prevent-host-death family protein